MTILQVILIALFFALCVGVSPANSVSQFVGGLFNQPIAIGTVVGAIMGDAYTGMVMGATINLVYLGIVSVGGETPANPGIAAIMGVSLGMASGLDAEAAVSLAVPFGIIGSVCPTLIRNFNLLFKHGVETSIQKRNLKAMYTWFYSAIPLRAILQFTAVFIALWGGSQVLEAVLGAIPASVLSALGVVGKALPAVGFAVGIMAVCKSENDIGIVYFILAFLAKIYLGVPVVFCTVIAVLICILKFASVWRKTNETESIDIEPAATQAKGLLTTKDLVVYEAYRWFFGQNIMNYEDYNGAGKAVCLMPLLKRLYPDNKEKQFERAEAHCQYFNSNVHTESLIFGMVAAMEEEKAMGKDVPDGAITAVKTGLMGPLAGVGDPFVQGVVGPILLTIAITLANNGSLLGGAFFPIAYGIFTIVCAAVLFALGYKGGKTAIEKVLSGNMMRYVTEIGTIVALVSFGALAAQTVTVSVGLAYGDMTVQSILDSLLQGIVPMALVLLAYSQLKKGTRVTTIVLVTLIVTLILGLFGILA